MIHPTFFHHEELISTNGLAKEMIKKKNAKDGYVVISDYQKGGKGQAGNQWESEKGKNILMSVIFFPNFLEVREQFNLSICTSLALADLISSIGLYPKIKWPNDIYVSNKKIAGLLIELSTQAHIIKDAVIGIGFNVNQMHFNDYQVHPVSLKMLTGISYPLRKIAIDIFERLEIFYRKLEEGNHQELKNLYLSQLYKSNEQLIFKANGRIFPAIIKDVEDSGQLVIEELNGKMSKYWFKEIEYVQEKEK